MIGGNFGAGFAQGFFGSLKQIQDENREDVRRQRQMYAQHALEQLPQAIQQMRSYRAMETKEEQLISMYGADPAVARALVASYPDRGLGELAEEMRVRHWRASTGRSVTEETESALSASTEVAGLAGERPEPQAIQALETQRKQAQSEQEEAAQAAQQRVQQVRSQAAQAGYTAPSEYGFFDRIMGRGDPMEIANEAFASVGAIYGLSAEEAQGLIRNGAVMPVRPSLGQVEFDSPVVASLAEEMAKNLSGARDPVALAQALVAGDIEAAAANMPSLQDEMNLKAAGSGSRPPSTLLGFLHERYPEESARMYSQGTSGNPELDRSFATAMRLSDAQLYGLGLSPFGIGGSTPVSPGRQQLQQQQQRQSGGGATAQAESVDIRNARRAIAEGRDRQAVIEYLRENGIEPPSDL